MHPTKPNIMYYDYIINNVSDLEKVINEVKAEAKKRAESSGDYRYCRLSIAIMCEETINAAVSRYGLRKFNYLGWLKDINTNPETTAEIVPYISVSYYHDARDGRCGFGDEHSSWAIVFDGVILDVYQERNGKMRFSLFGDNTDYNKFLPYGWHEQNSAPNLVGVVTDSKLAAWVKYLQGKRDAAKAVKEERNGNVCRFIERLAGLNPKEFKECLIDGNRGFIEQNGLRWCYEITDGGYISQKIEIAYWRRDKVEGDELDIFRKMIKGEFTEYK